MPMAMCRSTGKETEAWDTNLLIVSQPGGKELGSNLDLLKSDPSHYTNTLEGVESII